MKRDELRISLLYRGPQHEGRDDFSSFVPIGLFNILKSLRSAGYDASLHNLSATPRSDLADAIHDTHAHAFLISAFFGCHHEAYTLARTIKKQSPSTMVAMGRPLTYWETPFSNKWGCSTNRAQPPSTLSTIQGSLTLWPRRRNGKRNTSGRWPSLATRKISSGKVCAGTETESGPDHCSVFLFFKRGRAGRS